KGSSKIDEYHRWKRNLLVWSVRLRKYILQNRYRPFSKIALPSHARCAGDAAIYLGVFCYHASS
ncbi:MAG: hypothetical protein KAR37_08570, partial [Alphaproteobacteria bacterium]|nr:hypothetical protein [Alphaproteobacteria bacterium]